MIEAKSTYNSTIPIRFGRLFYANHASSAILICTAWKTVGILDVDTIKRNRYLSISIRTTSSKQAFSWRHLLLRWGVIKMALVSCRRKFVEDGRIPIVKYLVCVYVGWQQWSRAVWSNKKKQLSFRKVVGLLPNIIKSLKFKIYSNYNKFIINSGWRFYVVQARIKPVS